MVLYLYVIGMETTPEAERHVIRRNDYSIFSIASRVYDWDHPHYD